VLTGGPQGSWDNASVGRASIILDNGMLKMWYTVTNSSTSGHRFQIGYATSTDGINWRKNPNPVFSGGPAGSWDDKGAEAPSVVWNGTSFVMYFSGSNTTATNQIGVAFSSDGVQWREYPGNPVITTGPDVYDLGYVRYPDVIFKGGTYEMWYTGHPKFQTPFLGYSNVDYAVSKDGTHWTKFSGNSVIPPNMSPQLIGYSSYSSVIRLHDSPPVYFLATEVVPNTISYAVSTNATHFEPSTVPLLNGSVLPDQVGAIEFPSVLVNGSMVLLWYTVIHYSPSGPLTPSSTTWEDVNLAFCPFALAVSTATVISTLSETRILTTTSWLTMTSTRNLTTTSIVTTVQTETSVSLSTVSTTLVTTAQVAGANDPYYGGAIIALSAGFLAVVGLLLRRNRVL
jgi:predicted GH43/DUF377 family glycosyl hydrolase